MLKITDDHIEVGKLGEPFEKINVNTIKVDNDTGLFLVSDASLEFSGWRRRPTFLEAPDHSAWRFQNGAFTVSFWLRFDTADLGSLSTSSGQVFVNKENAWEIGVNGAGNIVVALNTGSGWGWRDSGITISGTSQEYCCRWIHVAWTWDGANHRFYIDGVLKGTVDNGSYGTGNPQSTTHPLRVGGRIYGNASWLNFAIGELKLYDGTALAEGSPDLGYKIFTYGTDPTSHPDLVGYFPFRGLGDYANQAPNGPSLSFSVRSNDESRGVQDYLADGGPILGGDPDGEVRARFIYGAAPDGGNALSLWEGGDRDNWLEDPLFMSLDARKTGWDRHRNGWLHLRGWTQYNGGVNQAAQGYHARVAPHQGLYGGNAIEFVDQNGYIGEKHRWIATTALTTNFFSQKVQNGDKVTVSVWVKSNSSHAKLNFGIYHSNPHSGGNDFETAAGEGRYTTPALGVVDEWVRVEHTWTIDDAYFDRNAESRVYFYGNYSTYETSLMISAPQIEVSTGATRASGFRAIYGGNSSERDLDSELHLPWALGKSLGTNEFSFGAWTRQPGRSTAGSIHRIFDFSSYSGHNSRLSLYLQDDYVHLTATDEAGASVSLQSPTAVMADGGWHHAAFRLTRSFNHDGLELYVDGTLVASDYDTLAGQSASADQLDLSGSRPNSQHFANVGSNRTTGYEPLRSEVYDVFMIAGTADLASYLDSYVPKGKQDATAFLAYSGDMNLTRMEPVESGVMRVLADREWTVFDPSTAELWGKFGRTYWEYSGLIEELPYGPGLSSLWFGPGGVRNWTARWGMATFNAYHSGVSASDREYSKQLGEFFRLSRVNPSTGSTHTEMLTHGGTGRLSAGQTATMRFIVRADDTFDIDNLTFFYDGSHHAHAPTKIKLSENTYLVFASHYVDSISNPKVRAVDFRNADTGNYSFLEVAHPVLTQESGNNGAKPLPFQWGNWQFGGGDSMTAEASTVGYIRIPGAAEIMGSGKQGTLVLAFNPANHQPGGYASIFVAGKDGEDMLGLIYGSNYNGGNRIMLSAQKGGSVTAEAFVNYNFSVFTWYYVAAMWGSGQLEIRLYDEQGNWITSSTDTYNDADFPDFTSLTENSIILGKKQAHTDSMNAILGPFAMRQSKISATAADKVVRELARGQLASFGRSSYLAKPIKTV